MMQRLLIAVVRGYRFWLSPWLRPGRPVGASVPNWGIFLTRPRDDAAPAHRRGAGLSVLAQSLARLGLPVRAELLALRATGAGAAWRCGRQRSDAAQAATLPPLVRRGP